MLMIKTVSYQGKPLDSPLACGFGEQGGGIGRADSNALVLPDPDRFVSRSHAMVLCRDGAFLIRDLSNNSPVILNGRPLGKGNEARLNDGDELEIGAYKLAVGLPLALTTAALAPIHESTGPVVEFAFRLSAAPAVKRDDHAPLQFSLLPSKWRAPGLSRPVSQSHTTDTAIGGPGLPEHWPFLPSAARAGARMTVISGPARALNAEIDMLAGANTHMISTLIHGWTDAEAAALAKTIESVSRIAHTLVGTGTNSTLEQVIEAAVPKTVAPPAALIEAEMLIRAKREILQSGDLLTSTQIAKIASLGGNDPGISPDRWKQERKIFTLSHDGTDYYPAYALDWENDFRPLKAMEDALGIFGNSKGGWALAFWFAGANSYLGGRRPQDVMASEPEKVLAAATWEVEPIAHG
jgi:hypothetical protein